MKAGSFYVLRETFRLSIADVMASIWSTKRRRRRGEIAGSNDLSEIERIEGAADCV